VFHCEWEEFPRKVLKHYWPKAISYGDITKTDFTIHRGRIDILTGGFPCQPYSAAGKRLGKEDDRHLWPQMLRTIREVQPRWVVGENVRGLVNWNGGLVFDEVQADLETEGYEVQPFLLPAAAVGAPHRRDRIWFVAYRKDGGLQRETKQEQENGAGKREFYEYRQGRSEMGGEYSGLSNARPTPDTDIDKRCERRMHQTKREATERYSGTFNSRNGRGAWENFPTQPPVRSRNDGISSRLGGITFPKWRNESIKAGGNAIVPQVALQIFKAIQEYETL